MTDRLRWNAWLSTGALFTSLTTLVCCALPATLVAMGAGAAVVGLVAAVPQLVWLSAHKALVFGVAGALLTVSAAALWQSRHLPCPADPALAQACRRLRRFSNVLVMFSAVALAAGAGVAFLLPLYAG